MQKITIERTTAPKAKPTDETKLGFGKIFTDHMFIMNYDEGEGWHNPRIVPYAPIALDPAAMCLHYGQADFEGLKAYRRADGSIGLFRPDQNMARLNVSNDRLCIPKIDEAFGVEAIKTLVEVDKDWVPHSEGTSLYIRPYIFAIDPMVGVHPAKHLLFVIILSPVGAYYDNGLAPVKIYVEEHYVRAVTGGTGFTKAAANYAISMKAQEVAEEQGYAGDHEQPLRLRRPFADIFTFQQCRALRVPERQHTAHVKQREDGGKRDGALPERGNTH